VRSTGRESVLSDQVTPQNKPTVVLVPGMLSPRITLLPMALRLRKNGYRTRLFSNRYLLETPLQNAQRLLPMLQAQGEGVVHLIGHSLGGIVIMHVLKLNSELPPNQRFADGKVVLIATPVRGSEFARRLYSKRFFNGLMARCSVGGVLDGMEEELDNRETGVISGTARRGISALVYKPEHPNDGLINTFETELEGAKHSIAVPQSHAAMLFSKRCAELSMLFLQHGRFVANC